jgi:hypothetical protein
MLLKSNLKTGENMPIVKKIVEIGGSKAVFLPKSWLEFWEQKHGCKIEKIAMEVNTVLKIYPITPKPKPKGGEKT